MESTPHGDSDVGPQPVAPLRIVAVSDTHEQHRWLLGKRLSRDGVTEVPLLPDGDVLVHCGDILRTSCRQAPEEALTKLRDFNDFLGEVKHKYTHGIIVIPGNHDTYLQRLGVDATQAILTNCRYLVYRGCTLGGVTFFGCPISHGYSCNQAYQDDAFDVAAHIPTFCDVLITHGSVHHPRVADLLRSGAKIEKVKGSKGETLTLSAVSSSVGLVNLGMRCRLHLSGHDHNNYGALVLDTLPALHESAATSLGLCRAVPRHWPLPQITRIGCLEKWPALQKNAECFPQIFGLKPPNPESKTVRFQTVSVVASTLSMAYRPHFFPVEVAILPRPTAARAAADTLSVAAA